MDKDNLKKIFLKPIIESGVRQVLHHKIISHLSIDDLKELYDSTYDYYCEDIGKPTKKSLSLNGVLLENFEELNNYYVEVENYERCIVLKRGIEIIKERAKEFNISL